MITREKFIKKCGYACLGSLFLPTLLQGCSSLNLVQKNYIEGVLHDSILSIPLSVFDNNGTKKLYVIVHHPQLKYPICVYRFSDTDYNALLMACTHQGTELQVFGEKLQCPAHGSEFNSKGLVENGPAAESLRTLPVQIQAETLNISLAKQSI